MKKFGFIAIIVVILIATGFYIVSDNKDKQNTQNKQQTINLSTKIETSNGQLIDVRTPEEYTSSHAQGALNVPLSEIQSGNVTKIDNTKPVYLYCRTGNRAGQAKTILEQAGYKNVTNIGGLADWQSQGGKVCSSDGTSC